MAKLEAALSALLEKHAFDCAVIADRDGTVLQRIGRYEDEWCIAALNRDFFDPVAVRALADYLDGKIMPQLSSSAPWWSLSGFTPDGKVIAMYGRSFDDVRKRYLTSKEVWRELETLWSVAER